MEKINLKSAFLILLGVFSITGIFAGEMIRINFNAKGGTVNPQYVSVEMGKQFDGELPTPTKDGCHFGGWLYEDGKKFDKAIKINKATTLYAQWNNEVSFDAENGKPNPKTIMVENGITLDTTTLERPQRDFYKFDGWYHEDSDGAEIPIYKDLTLHAKWKNGYEDLKQELDFLENEVKTLNDRILRPLVFFVVAGILALFLIGLLALTIVFVLKFKKKICKLQKKTEEIFSKQKETEEKLTETQTNILDSMQELTASEPAHNTPVIQDNSAQYKMEITRLQDRNAELERTIRNMEEQARVTAERNLDAVTAFNNWAANPSAPLPSRFNYIEGKMGIRSKQTIVESMDTSSKWISNRNEEKRYLFPNPNSFDQMTNINQLYTGIDQDCLKEKGKNKIKIIEPCTMTSDGFVEFEGKLIIL